MADVGIARALLELITSKFEQGAKIVQTLSRQTSKDVESIGESADKASEQIGAGMGRARDSLGRFKKTTEDTAASAKGAFGGIGAAIDRANGSAKAFGDSVAGKIQKGLDDIASKVQKVSLAAGVMTGLGVKAAQDLKTLTTGIELLAGSQLKAQKIMDDTRKLADDFHSPYLDLLSGARAFLPLAKKSGLEINELLKTAIKFQAYNPQKNFDEIKFSINEALTGDFVSIKDSLDLSKKQREELKKAFEESGPGAVLAGINKILEERGFNDDTIRKFGESGANAFKELRSEVQETLATAFMPLLTDVVLPLVKKISEFVRNLRETNPVILKIGAAVTVIVAALYPLTTILTTLIGLWKAVGVAAAFAGKNMMGAAGTVAKTGLAVGAGVGVGLAGATALAKAGVGDKNSDLERIRKGESAGDILAERIKQIIVIFAKGVIEIGRLMAKAGAFIWNAIDQVVNAFKFLNTFLVEFGGNIQIALGNLLMAIGKFVQSIPGQEEAGKGIITSGVQTTGAGGLQVAGAIMERDRLMKRLAEGFTVPQSTIDNIDKTFDDISNTIVGGLTDFLFPVEQAAEVTAENLKQAGDILGSVAEGVFNSIKSVFENIVNAVTDTDSEDYLKKQAEDITTATKKYNEDIANIENERLQSMSEANQQFADDQVKIAQDAADASKKALEDAIADRDKLMLEMNRDEQKSEREETRKVRDKQIDAMRQEAEDTQAHADRLTEIRNKQRQEEESALMDFDFRRLFEATTQNAAELAKENTDFDAQRKARNTALQNELTDMQTAFNDERDERRIKFSQDLDDRAAQYQQEQAQLQQQTAQKQAELVAQHNAELQQIQTKYQTELQLRQQAMQQELQLLVMSEKQRNAFLLGEQQKYMEQAVALAQQFGLKLSQSLQGAYAPNALQVAAKTIASSPLGTTVSNIGSSLGNVVTNIGNTLFGGLNKKASGGYLGAYQSAVVNEPGSSQMERWLSGGRSYDMGGTAVLTPLRGGRVDPNRGGGNQNSITVPITINAPVDESIIPLIRQAAEQGAMNALEALQS